MATSSTSEAARSQSQCLRGHLRAPAAGMERGLRLAAAARAPARRTSGLLDLAYVVVDCCHLRVLKGGPHRPEPCQPRPAGQQNHLLADTQGIPLAVILTGGNRNDITQLLPQIDAIPPIHGLRERPAAARASPAPTVATTTTSTDACSAHAGSPLLRQALVEVRCGRSGAGRPALTGSVHVAVGMQAARCRGSRVGRAAACFAPG
jgi:hypothetical protein